MALEINGKLFATSDLNLAVQLMNKNPAVNKVIYLGDPISKPFELSTAINGVGWVPDYNTLQFIVHNDMPNFIQFYTMQLQGDVSAKTLFATMFKALTMGTLIILYFPQEAKDLKYPEILLQYLRSTYGIQAQTKNTEFAVAPNTLEVITHEMFDPSNGIELISAEEFITNIENIDDIDIMKLKFVWVTLCPDFMRMEGKQAAEFVEKKKQELQTYGRFLSSAFSFMA